MARRLSVRALLLQGPRPHPSAVWPLPCPGLQQTAAYARGSVQVAEGGNADASDPDWDRSSLTRERNDARTSTPGPDQYGRPPRDFYNTRINHLATRERRPWLVRLVYEEMQLDGVPPNWTTFEESMYQCMRARRVGDTLFFFNEMRRRGFVPNAYHYTMLVSVFGRAGRLTHMTKTFEEIRAIGLKPLQQTYQSMLNALASAGHINRTLAVAEDMAAGGYKLDENAYAALLRCYGKSPMTGSDHHAQILKLLREGREVATKDASSPADSLRQDVVVINAALQALGECGFHQECVDLFESMEQKYQFHPASLMHDATVQSYLADALGTFRQPQGAELQQLVEKQLSDRRARDQPSASPQPSGSSPAESFVSAAESAPDESSLRTAESAPADSPAGASADSARPSSSESFAGAAESSPDESSVQAAESGAARPTQEDESYLRDGSGSDQDNWGESGRLRKKRGTADSADESPFSTSDDSDSEQNRMEELVQSHRRKKASNWHQARELRNQDRHVFLQARTAVYEQHMSGRSFDAAIGLFREAEEHRNLISPERCRDMVLAALRFHTAGKKDALGAAHLVLDFMDRTHTFVNTEMGSTMLRHAVRRKVNDLTVAHRLWRTMRASGRQPLAEAVNAYGQALHERERATSKNLIQEVEELLESHWKSMRGSRDLHLEQKNKYRYGISSAH